MDTAQVESLYVWYFLGMCINFPFLSWICTWNSHIGLQSFNWKLAESIKPQMRPWILRVHPLVASAIYPPVPFFLSPLMIISDTWVCCTAWEQSNWSNQEVDGGVNQQFDRPIPVGCLPPACTNCACFNSHQMSALVGVLKWTSLNRSPLIVSRYH